VDGRISRMAEERKWEMDPHARTILCFRTISIRARFSLFPPSLSRRSMRNPYAKSCGKKISTLERFLAESITYLATNSFLPVRVSINSPINFNHSALVLRTRSCARKYVRASCEILNIKRYHYR